MRSGLLRRPLIAHLNREGEDARSRRRARERAIGREGQTAGQIARQAHIGQRPRPPRTGHRREARGGSNRKGRNAGRKRDRQRGGVHPHRPRHRGSRLVIAVADLIRVDHAIAGSLVGHCGSRDRADARTPGGNREFQGVSGARRRGRHEGCGRIHRNWRRGRGEVDGLRAFVYKQREVRRADGAAGRHLDGDRSRTAERLRRRARERATAIEGETQIGQGRYRIARVGEGPVSVPGRHGLRIRGRRHANRQDDARLSDAGVHSSRANGQRLRNRGGLGVIGVAVLIRIDHAIPNGLVGHSGALGPGNLAIGLVGVRDAEFHGIADPRRRRRHKGRDAVHRR